MLLIRKLKRLKKQKLMMNQQNNIHHLLNLQLKKEKNNNKTKSQKLQRKDLVLNYLSIDKLYYPEAPN